MTSAASSRSPSPHPTRRAFLRTSILSSAGVMLSGCGWTLAEVRPVQAGRGRSDELALYTWTNYVDPPLVEAFTTQTGIRVTYDIFNSNEIMLATFQAGKGATYSILYPSDYKVEEMIELEFLSELDHTRIDGLSNILPQFQNSAYDPGNRHSVPISWGTTGLIYDADRLNPEPEDWTFLWDYVEPLKRRMTLLDDVREVMGATLRSLGHSYNSTDPQQIKAAYEKLVQLKPAIASFTTDAWKEQLLAGDLVLAMVYSADAVRLIKDNPDRNLKYVIPQSGTSLWSDTIVIPKTAPNPDAAYAWINYMLQPSVAAQITQRQFFATPNQAAYDQLPAPLRNNTSLFPPDEILASSERISPIAPKVLALYERYWTLLTSS
ncbi:polyamine ABC transporter substrate-binding protein [Pantanalinema rosaneae CENA516]|uniref:polyamine ABC transporter substrate-binding protein n=1 Tax=Pantanalinema rosaneae TaxID=1620701 RepID=UPI003D6E64CA